MTLETTPVTVDTRSGETLEIRPAKTTGEMQKFYQWSHHVGFIPAANEYRIYCDSPHNWPLIGLVNNVPVSCLLVHIYDNHTAFFGPYIVANAQDRRKGYGKPLWHYALDRLKGYNVGCFASKILQPSYEKFGFQTFYSFEIRQGEFPAQLRDQAARHHHPQRYEIRTWVGKAGTQELAQGQQPPQPMASQCHLPSLAHYDYIFTGLKRPELISQWGHTMQPHALVLCDVATDGHPVVAMGAIYRTSATNGYRLGPWYANDKAAAKALALELMTRVVTEEIKDDRGQPFVFDTTVSLSNLRAVQLMDEFGWHKVVDHLGGMWTQDMPEGMLEKDIYGCLGAMSG
ncbi:hypothetical protein H4R34_001949 [Dimargaris verticillata]|uniref:N-acetyltransferase domain-containing protein n=1 Tax=Dimargaris verticillata TaxID=2761393 RepID=A0A9W8E9S3_9FUNG|nr:hypothetical protein H4R34_001949 [Dimargaris verticillata]